MEKLIKERTTHAFQIISMQSFSSNFLFFGGGGGVAPTCVTVVFHVTACKMSFQATTSQKLHVRFEVQNYYTKWDPGPCLPQ